MKQNFRNLITIVTAIIIAVIVINGCTTQDKKCMPFTSTSKKAKALVWEGQAILADGFSKQAIELFKQALALDSNFVVANLYYGQNAGLGNAKRSEFFKKAEKNMGNVSEAEQHMVKSYLALEKGDTNNVINEIKGILEFYPEDKYMLRLLAVRYYLYGKYENALEYIQKSCDADTGFSTAVYYKGYVLSALNRKEEAENCYKKSIAMKPDVPLYYLNYGYLLRGANRIDEAIAVTKKAVDLESTYSGNFSLGHCYVIKGEYDLARECYSKAYDLAVSNAQKNIQLSYLSLSWLYEGKLADAMAAIDKKTEFDKAAGNMDVEILSNFINKGLSYLQYNDPENAEKCFKEFAALNNTLNITEKERSDNAKYVIFYRGWTEAMTGKAALARKSMDEFRKTMVDDAELEAKKLVWNCLQGGVAFSEKKWADAASILQPLNLSITSFYAGVSYQNNGDTEKARDVFTKLAGNYFVGFQQALIRPFAKSKLEELNK